MKKNGDYRSENYVDLDKQKKEEFENFKPSNKDDFSDDSDDSDDDESQFDLLGKKAKALTFNYVFKQSNHIQMRVNRRKIFNRLVEDRKILKKSYEKLQERYETEYRTCGKYKNELSTEKLRREKLKYKVKILKKRAKELRHLLKKQFKESEEVLSIQKTNYDEILVRKTLAFEDLMEKTKETHEEILIETNKKLLGMVEVKEKELKSYINKNDLKLKKEEGELKKKTKKLDGLKNEYYIAIKDSKDLKNKFKTFQITSGEKDNLLMSTTVELETMTSDFNKKHFEVESLTSTLFELRNKYNRLSKEHILLKESCEKLKTIAEEMTIKSCNRVIEIKKMKRERRKSDFEFEKLRGSLSGLEINRAEIKRKLSSEIKEKEKARGSSEKMTQAFVSLKKDLGTEKAHIRILEKQILQEKNRYNTLLNKIEAGKNEDNATITRLTSRLNSMKRDLNLKERLLETANFEKKVLENSVKELQKQITSLKKKSKKKK